VSSDPGKAEVSSFIPFRTQQKVFTNTFELNTAATSSPKVVVQNALGGHIASIGGIVNVGETVDARLIAEALARHEEATRGMKSPDDMIVSAPGL
jgi:hypothetical protein